jgi:arylsulfatase A-like enzyme
VASADSTEHYGQVGPLLGHLDELKIGDSTIVLHTTDSCAARGLWPGRAMTMFHGEKGATRECGPRIPRMVR